MGKKTRPKIEFLEVEGFPIITIKGKNSYLLFQFQNGFVELKRITVNKKYRRIGYGTILVKELEKFTKDAGLNEIKVDTTAKPTQRLGRFLTSLGFRKIGTPPFLWEKKI